MASMRSTKFQRRTSAPPSEIGSKVVRAVEAPQRVDKSEHETNAVVLGSREPEDGRYASLVRTNFRHGMATVGSAGTKNMPSVTDMELERRKRAQFMGQKNFRFDSEGQEVPLVSEVNGAQESSRQLAQRMWAAHNRDTPSPTPLTDVAFGRPTGPALPPLVAQAEEIKVHMDRMRSSNVFHAPTAAAAHNRVAEHGRSSSPSRQDLASGPVGSTQRLSFVRHDTRATAKQREDAAKLRHVQTATNWATTGGDKKQSEGGADAWISMKEATITGAPGAPAELNNKYRRACVHIGSESVSAKDTLQSLHQVDFKPHQQTHAQSQAPAFTAHEDHLVLGYRARDLDSTSRVSYTPTRFVPPANKHTAPRQFRADRPAQL